MAEKGDRMLSRGESLALVKKITQEMFTEETDEIKDEVLDRFTYLRDERERERERADEDDDYDAGSSERRPEDYQRYMRLCFLMGCAYGLCS